MALSQELLQAITDMQLNAQERLPVIPNNGNPRGANNMATGGNQPAVNTGVVPPSAPPAQTQPPVKSPYAYPWLAPSASVERIRNMLSPATQPPVNLNQPQPVSQTQPMVPLLPIRREGMY